MSTSMKKTTGLSMALLLIVALLALAAADRASQAQPATAPAPSTRPMTQPGIGPMPGPMMGKCPMCPRMMQSAEQLSKLLDEAHMAAMKAGASEAAAKIAQAQDVVAKQQQDMRLMKEHMEKMHGMKPATMPAGEGAVVCPMCGMPIGEAGPAKTLGEGHSMHQQNMGQAKPAGGLTTTVVNARCPIMGTDLDRGKVAIELTRKYKGQTVGFCCPACPPAWDKLSDQDKDKKLQAAMP